MDCIDWLDCLSVYKGEIQTVISILLAIAGVFGLVFLLFRTIALTRSSNAAARQAALAERGHRTDRFIKAIDQLGALKGDAPNIEVRLGGIYGLEQLARESDEHYTEIMKVLSAYVRSNSFDTAYEEDNGHGGKNVKYKPMEDIQAILSVIGQRDRKDNEEVINLSGSWLSGYNFSRGDYSRVNFSFAHCEDADFAFTDCIKAKFVRSHCQRTSFSSANLEKADFESANCERATFSHANCKKACFLHSNCNDATFSAAICKSSLFTGAKCNTVNFQSADLKYAVFDGCQCEYAFFRDANIFGARFNNDCEKIASASYKS